MIAKSLMDFDPFRSLTVGFDNMFDTLDTIDTNVENYPPYNIQRNGEYNYLVEVAIAGFNRKDIEIEYGNNALTIIGSKDNKDKDNADVVHQGIATRSFKRTFSLADDVVVKSANLSDGLLTIDLEKIVPEEKKTRKIEITERKPNLKKVDVSKSKNVA
tara:strand:+ start:15 stop:491 length:477 start_codon:yes stop_codon:yes gene_type:complete